LNLLTKEQAAAQCGVSVAAIDRSAMPRFYLKVGERWCVRFHPADVAVYRGNLRSRQPESWPSQRGKAA